MKKIYSKPQILFDSFELSQSIASCEMISNHVRRVCALEDPTFGKIFMQGVNGCETWVPDGSLAGVCYELPDGAITLFSS